ncbi:MAG: NADPH-dependent F420 reductase [Acidothermus cellulolyticus]|nr:NADPH-dependent F420 reductase [Acidothermus cellulolyticus]
MERLRLAVVGGTGPQGRSLAYRFAVAGHHVVIGSRVAERASRTAEEIQLRVPRSSVVGRTNNEAAADCPVVLLAVPYEGHADVVTSLRDCLVGKVVISCVNPLSVDKTGARAVRVPHGSAAEEAAALAPGADVIAAFHHLSAAKLWRDDESLAQEDVLVCGDSPTAKNLVMELASAVTGRPGVDAGPLRMAGVLESFTGVLININKRYKTRSGIAIVGLAGRSRQGPGA